MSLNLLSPALFVNHRGESAADQPSTRIWSKVKGQAVSPDGTGLAKGITTNFCEAGTYDASAATGQVPGTGFGAYVDIATTAGSITPLADGTGIKILTGTTDNHQASISSGGNVGGLGTLTLSGGKLVAFEARVAFTGSAADAFAPLVGVAEPGSAADNSVTDAGAVGAFDFLGFYTADVADGSDILNFGYRVAAGSLTAVSGVAQTITAGTFYKLGFILDPSKAEECLTVYIDGAQVASVSKATLDAATGFPDTTNFAAIAVIKTLAAAAQRMDIDFLHCVVVG